MPGAEIPLFSHCGAKEGSSAIRCGLCKVFACRPAGVGTARPHCKFADSARRGEQARLKIACCRNSSTEVLVQPLAPGLKARSPKGF